MVEVKTVNDAFLQVSGRGDKVAWLWRDEGDWKPIAGAEAYGRVRALAGVLAGWGVGKGDRVAIVSENRWEWPVTDFAVLALGAVDVPLYPTLTAEQVGYLLRDSGAKVAVVSSREQMEKVRAAGEIPGLEHLVVMDQPPDLGLDLCPVSWMGELLARSEEMQGQDVEFEARLRAVGPEDLATIIYTSGTTGEPKGVMLTHGNLASNFTLSSKPFGFGETDACISFLPLSHITARHLDYALMCDGVTIAYCPKIDQLAAAMKAVRPSILVAVPRVYEKIRQGVEGKSAGLKKKILEWALGVGKKHRAQTLDGRRSRGLAWKLAEKLVFSKIWAAFGGRVEVFVSGAAPLGMDTAEWFADVGIRILEGYGMTETSVIAVNTRLQYRIGTVGPVLAGFGVRFAEDEELEVKGPAVFAGYWHRPLETAEAFTADGWFRTGDIGRLEDGFLSITDRKKELLKTSGGKFIAPQPIENKLRAHALVGNAALVGDRHKFACALISPNFAALEGWAKAQGIAADNRAALVKQPKVVAEYKAIVARVNETLARFETIKRFAVVPDEWSIEAGELTPSMKLKRRVVERKYEAEIAGFYKDEATAGR
jgi:long-chain acyl-CoA synthetase